MSNTCRFSRFLATSKACPSISTAVILQPKRCANSIAVVPLLHATSSILFSFENSPSAINQSVARFPPGRKRFFPSFAKTYDLLLTFEHLYFFFIIT